MSVTSLTALVTGLAALAGAVGGIIAMIRHVTGPSHTGKQ
jgi:hypothetical protein